KSAYVAVELPSYKDALLTQQGAILNTIGRGVLAVDVSKVRRPAHEGQRNLRLVRFVPAVVAARAAGGIAHQLELAAVGRQLWEGGVAGGAGLAGLARIGRNGGSSGDFAEADGGKSASCESAAG